MSDFPVIIDSIPLVAADDDTDSPSHSAVTNVSSQAIVALETKVGKNNSTDPNSLDYKIAHGGSGGDVPWDVDPQSNNGVTRVRSSTGNFLSNAAFGIWFNGTSAVPNGWTIDGDVTIAQSNTTTQGPHSAQLTFGTANTGEFFQDANVSTEVDYTFTCYVQLIGGSGNARLVAQEEGGSFTEYASTNLSHTSGWQLASLTVKPSAGTQMRFSIKSGGTATSVWLISECMYQESKAVATTFQYAFIDDSNAQNVYGNKTFGFINPAQVQLGSGPSLFGGSGAPSGTLGSVGDRYFRDDAPVVEYRKIGSSAWIWDNAFDVSRYGAFGNGTTDDTTAVAAAATAASASGGAVFYPPGIYKQTSIVTITNPDVSVLGAGSAFVVIKPSSAVTGATFRISNPSFNPSTAFSNTFAGGTIGGFTIDGTNATGSGACGLHYGDIMNGKFDDLTIQNFTGSSSIGLWMDNLAGWTERMTWSGVQVNNCTKCIVFDVNSNVDTGGTGGYASFGYNDFGMVKLTPFANQDGIVVRNGILLNGSKLSIMANCGASTSGGNTGVLLRVTGSSTSGGGLSYSSMFGVTIHIGAETDQVGGSFGTPHQTINVDSNVLNQVQLQGTLGFYNTWTATNVAKGGSAASFTFSGFSYGDANLSDGGSFASSVVIGGSAKTLGAYPVGAGELFISTGDVFDFGALFQNATISLSGTPTMPREIWVFMNQPSSGGPYTVTWPGSTVIQWVGGTPPTMPTAANARMFVSLRTSSAGINPWVGQVLEPLS